MPLKILADENVDYRIVNALRTKDFEIISIADKHKGLPDKEVLELAKKENALLLTEDNDFGEWVFVHKEKLSVIFIRYKPTAINKIIESLVKTIMNYGDSLVGKFVVITVNKIRIRDVLE